MALIPMEPIVVSSFRTSPLHPGPDPVAGLEAGHDILHRVGPDIIYQAVLPLMAPLCNRGRHLIGQLQP